MIFAGEDGGVQLHRIALMIEEHAVDAQADLELGGAGLEVAVAGSGHDGGLQKLVHQRHRGSVLTTQ